jgi:predicted DNA-binding antitoxin AbrB/MazE fold protein
MLKMQCFVFLAENPDMSTVEAIYQGGVSRPLEVVDLAENQRVRISVRPIEGNAGSWLAEVRAVHEQLMARRGNFPVSTPDIAADRTREK